MTREEFFKKHNSLEAKCDELKEKLYNAEKECDAFLSEYVKNLLGVEEGDIIYQKDTGDAFEIFYIYVSNKVIRLSIEDCGASEYTTCIDEKTFLSDYMTESQWKELNKKQIEDSELQEYLRLKDKFEKLN